MIPAKKLTELKAAIATVLTHDIGVGLPVDDLCVYRDPGGLFAVDFTPVGSLEAIDGLSEEQNRQITEDGEINDYFETAEEAAEEYLKLRFALKKEGVLIR
jgi:hypothetical protein